MKKILTSFLALTLIIGAAQAQDTDKDHGKHFGKGKGGHEMVAKDLNLTESQKTQMKKLREDMQAEMKAVHQNGSLTQDQAKQQRQAISEKYRKQMDGILTPEQRSKIEAGKKDHQQRGVGQREDRMQQMEQQLNLTADQKSRMESIKSNFAARRESIMNNSSLTKEQKREQFKALAKEHQEQVKAVLTDEQEKKAQELMKEHRTKEGKEGKFRTRK